MFNKVLLAAQFANTAHSGQKRKYTGRPYIEHPLRVASRCMIIPRFGEVEVIAALLHDVLEDTDVPASKITTHFGESVTRFVEYLTNPSKQRPDLNRAARKQLDREFLAHAPLQIKIIKFLDRIDNLREMDTAPDGFVKKYKDESKLLCEALGQYPEGLGAAGVYIPTLLDLKAELESLLC